MLIDKTRCFGERSNKPLKLPDPPRHGPCLRKARAAPARSLTERYTDLSKAG